MTLTCPFIRERDVTDKPAILEAAVTALGRASQLEEVQRIVRTSARQLASAQGATLVLLQDGHCFYADEDAISPLWKGQRFPVEQCISGWAMLHQRAAVVPDIQVDDRIPQEAYLPTFVRSLAMVPIRVDDPIGAIGAYWFRPRRANDDEVALLRVLAEAAGEALERLLSAPCHASAERRSAERGRAAS
jgi:GAF domain-containing protein